MAEMGSVTGEPAGWNGNLNELAEEASLCYPERSKIEDYFAPGYESCHTFPPPQTVRHRSVAEAPTLPVISGLVNDLIDRLPKLGKTPIRTIKSVFCGLLGYESMDSPVPKRLLTSQIHNCISRLTIIAEHGTIKILLVYLAHEVTRGIRAGIVVRLDEIFPGSIFVLMSRTATQVELGWAGLGSEPEAIIWRLLPSPELSRAVAERLALLRVFRASDEPVTEAELRRSIEFAFGSLEPTEVEDQSDYTLTCDELFYRELERHPLLSEAETWRLFHEFNNAHSAEGAIAKQEAVKHRLILGHLRLICWVIKRERVGSRLRSLTIVDLVQEGVRGLNKAIERFNPSKGIKFATYAYHWVRQAVTRGHQSSDAIIRLPSHAYRVLSAGMRLSERLFYKLNREPSVEDLIECANSNHASVQSGDERPMSLKILKAAWLLLKGAPVTGVAGPDCPCAQLPDSRSLVEAEEELSGQAESETIAERHRRVIERAMSEANVPSRTRSILQLRYGIQCDHVHTLREIANNLSLTRERVRQLERAGLEKLRAWRKRKHLEFEDI